MIYAVILAGGIGTRMDADKPKQYLNIGDKPIIVHTIEKFYLNNNIDEVLVLCPKQWIEYTDLLINKYIPCRDNIIVISGGETRNETIMNAIRYIEGQGRLDEDTIIITHDAVRPFVTSRIIADNINALEVSDACDTVVPATDTIVESLDNSIISNIPDRSKLYQGQTPQSFKAMKLKQLYKELTEEERKVLTDAAKIFVIKGHKVSLVEGETYNLKITYPYDVTVAEAILQRGSKC